MLKWFFRLILTIGATFWMIIIFVIKEHWTFCSLPVGVVSTAFILFPITLSGIFFVLFRFLERDSLEECIECVLADNDFLPVYLGYFFVALSINDFITLCYVYTIIFVFTFLTQTQYFNPVFLVFGYHFYHVVTSRGTKIFIIKRGKIIRNVRDMKFDDLRRLNDTTYIVSGD